jgi:ribosomal protein L12E/L44/L45/RPP1/RPP2
MKTSVIEVHDMLSVLSVDDVEKRIGEVLGVAAPKTPPVAPATAGAASAGTAPADKAVPTPGPSTSEEGSEKRRAS